MKWTRAAAAALLVLLAGCTAQWEMHSQPVPESDGQAGREIALQQGEYGIDSRFPQELQQLVAGNRAPLFRAYDQTLDTQVQALLTQGLNSAADRRTAALVVTEPIPLAGSITQQQAREELLFLFDYLKYGYSGYGYLGGDDRFLPVRDQMLADLDNMGELIPVTAYQSMLTGGLTLQIPDCHFILGGVMAADSFSMAHYNVNESVLFAKEGDGFYTTIDEIPYRLEQVDGAPPDHWIKPIVTAEGRMAWAVAATRSQWGAFSVTLELRAENGEMLTHPLVLQTTTPGYNTSESPVLYPYQLLDASGVPLVRCRRLWADTEQDEHGLRQMLEDAPALAKEQAVIVDLRGNGGGNDYWAKGWVEAFSGRYPHSTSIYCVLQSATTAASFGEAAQPSAPGWQAPRVEAPAPIPNNTLVLVLVDEHVGSSAEIFVRSLQQMQNVIVIGSNTEGCQTFGEVRTIYLPHSGVQLQCGHKLFLERDLQFIEGTGIEPDLWAPPEYALDRALALMAYYL